MTPSEDTMSQQDLPVTPADPSGVQVPLERVQVEDDVAARVQNHGVERLEAFMKTGKLSDLTDAISILQRAVDITPHDHARMPHVLSNLALSLHASFERRGELGDIVKAISLQQRAVRLSFRGNGDLPRHLTDLGNLYSSRFTHTGVLSDIDDAISVQQLAVDLTRNDHADLPMICLSNLGASYLCRFERTGVFSDITDAISMLKRAIDLAPQDNLNLPARLCNLGTAYWRRFIQTGVPSDIAEAISVQQRALNLTPQNHADTPTMLLNLGNTYSARFDHTGVLSDITEAISLQKRAVDLLPSDHAHLPQLLNDLGISYWRRFRAADLDSDITEAISVQKRAADLAQDHSHLPTILDNLGISYSCRYERTGMLSDITNAISVKERGIALASQHHVDLPVMLNNLGHSYSYRFQRNGELADINKAISVRQQAVDLMPCGHADRTPMVINLGRMFHLRSALGVNEGDLEATLSHYRAAATSPVGSPRAKLSVARRWAKILIQENPRSPDTILSFDTALGLVAVIAGLDQTVQERYAQLEESSGLAVEAAATACALDRTDKALEWLEQGRCLVWSQLNDFRTPLDDLRARDEELAQSIAAVAMQLETVGSSRAQSDASMSLREKISLEDEARTHGNLAKRWDDLLKTTRAIPGFESFLMPVPCSTIMQNLPKSGPIVIINLDGRRCDALALLDGLDKPILISLPNFSYAKGNKYRSDLDSQLRTRHLRSRAPEEFASADRAASGRAIKLGPAGRGAGTVHQVLRGLWEDIVKPVLDSLGFSRVDTGSGDVPPKLWWCPTGPLSFLPLHAAGIYGGSSPETALDYVISSYTPTITAITNIVNGSRSIDPGVSGLFLTSHPNPSNASVIPGTTKEVRSIFANAEKSGIKVLKIEGDELTVDECLERMQQFSCIHLACHGSQNAAEPLKSRFLLHQGSLELGTILRSNLKNADLAFLSACQTSTGEEKLPDEAVHLAAGMLAAGYRRVVGTMWSISDQAAQDVSVAYYEYLLARQKGGDNPTFDGTHSAHALYHATQQLRDRLDDSEDSLLTWIPFVHFGY